MLDKTIILARAKRAAQEAESWWPLSPGQLRHQLIAAGDLPNTQEAADALLETLAIAFRTGDIPRSAVALTGAMVPALGWGVQPHGGDAGPRIDLQADQPRRVVVIATNRGLATALEPFCADWSAPILVPLFAEASYGARRWLGPVMADASALSMAGPATALVLDDYDVESDAPVMRDLFTALECWTNQMRGDLRIRHLAVTIEDIERLGPLPTSKAAFFTGGRILDVVPVEAVPPGKLRAILAAAIEEELDMALFRARVDHERALYIGGGSASTRTVTTCSGGEA